MAHHWDDSEAGGYGPEVMRAWLSDCLNRGVTGWSSNREMEVDCYEWVNARVQRLSFCSPRATHQQAREMGLIAIEDERYTIKLDRQPIGDGSSEHGDMLLGADGTWRVAQDHRVYVEKLQLQHA